MRKTRSISIMTQELESIICDICGKEYAYGTMEAEMEMQEFFGIQQNCGYGSVFGDCISLEVDICQYCLKEILGEHFHAPAVKFDTQ